MKKAGFLLFLSLFIVHFSAAQKPLSVEDCFSKYPFYPEIISGFRFLKDGKHYLEPDEKGLKIKDISNADFDSLLIAKEFAPGQFFDEFSISETEDALLLRSNTTPVYRHSVLAEYHVFNMVTQTAQPVLEGQKLQQCALSPDGKSVAYVLENDLYCLNLETRKSARVTNDGAKNAIINGMPDWVYEEEFSPVTGDGMEGLKWSENSQKIAFLRFDETEVPELPLTWYENGTYPRHTSFKYPKVGEANSVVSAFIYDIKSGRNQMVETPENAADYLVRLNWTTDDDLIISRLNRMQDTLDLLLCTPDFDRGNPDAVAPTRLLLRETDKAYVEVHDNLTFLKDGIHFLWTSESDGYNHLYLYDLRGKMVRQLTKGSFDITTFYGINQNTGKYYYQAATPTPLDRQLWEGDLAGGAPRLLTPSTGTWDAEFSPTFDYYVLTHSDANTPPVITLCNGVGETLRTLTSNEEVRKKLKAYGCSAKEFIKIPLANGLELNGWLIKPSNMEPGKKYPVLLDVYGGPGSQTVQNQYDGYMSAWHQVLVNKGYIIASVDNRGTGARGAEFKKCTQLQLGALETADQIAAAKYLGSLPFVDKDRIGIWGWSFGGYLSTSCILKGADVFKMAMAVAPVTNWKWYDSAYTERYMHTGKDNASGYEKNSPVNFAAQLKGGNYLICHGIADDNVHWQQTTEMINALIANAKQFETYSYPNRNHGIYGENATLHLFTKLTDFVTQKL